MVNKITIKSSLIQAKPIKHNPKSLELKSTNITQEIFDSILK